MTSLSQQGSSKTEWNDEGSWAEIKEEIYNSIILSTSIFALMLANELSKFQLVTIGENMSYKWICTGIEHEV
jgi:hypothetical protein